jgi:hypothetical protein
MFENVKIRCSSLGKLMTEPKSVADKKAGALSENAKTMLVEVYAKAVYGREKEVQSKPMKKGVLVEDDSITTLSMYDGVLYQKNEVKYENEFISGTPDIITNYEFVIDIKSSYDIWTFLANVDSKIDKGYWWQLQGYMMLTNKRKASLVYCLSNMPDHLVETEKYYLLKRLDVISEESPEYLIEAAKLERILKYDDIPVNERVIKYDIDFDDSVVELVESKVKTAREYLKLFHKKRGL